MRSPGAPGDERGGRHQAGPALGGQVAVDHVAAGAGLVGELQLRPGGHKFADHAIQGIQVAADLAVKPHLGAGTGLGNGYINRHLMDIQPHIQYTFFHGLPPWLWLCAVSFLAHSLTHVCKVGRPLTFNHYVYEYFNAFQRMIVGCALETLTADS